MLIRHRGLEPTVDASAYVAPNATLVGDVRVGPRARIRYGAVLDAEGSTVEVGGACVLSEHAVLRATGIGPHPVVLADHVFLSPHAEDRATGVLPGPGRRPAPRRSRRTRG